MHLEDAGAIVNLATGESTWPEEPQEANERA
jgi:hypothetical protein